MGQHHYEYQPQHRLAPYYTLSPPMAFSPRARLATSSQNQLIFDYYCRCAGGDPHLQVLWDGNVPISLETVVTREYSRLLLT